MSTTALPTCDVCHKQCQPMPKLFVEVYGKTVAVNVRPTAGEDICPHCWSVALDTAKSGAPC